MSQMPKLVLNAARWLNFAEEAKGKADAVQLPATRQQFLKRAEIYRLIAEIALRHANKNGE
jgi:hypothetical protein